MASALRASSSRAAAGRMLRARLENRSRRRLQSLRPDCSVASLPRNDGLRPVSTPPHCSHGGIFFRPADPVNDAQSAPPTAVARRTIIDRIAGTKHAPPCETMGDARSFQRVALGLEAQPRRPQERAPSSRAAAGRMLRIRLENRSRRGPQSLSLDCFLASLRRNDGALHSVSRAHAAARIASSTSRRRSLPK
jgi:hypothetical protein